MWLTNFTLLLAHEARLLAERDGDKEITFPAEFLDSHSSGRQRDRLAIRTNSLLSAVHHSPGQIAILDRGSTFNSQIGGITVEKATVNSHGIHQFRT